MPRWKTYTRHSDETKRKIAIGNTGKQFTQERRDRIGEANRKTYDYELIQKIKEMIEEHVCSFEAVLREFDLKNLKSIRRSLEEFSVDIHKLKFFNRAIDYHTGKLLLSYLKLNLHVDEISKRLNLSKKTIWGSCKKLEEVHSFKWKPRRKICRENQQTKIEFFVESILKNNQIEYEREFQFENFYFDFWIKGTGLFIETNGDYWHANPDIYKDKTLLTETQKRMIRRDHLKRKMAKEKGFYTFYIWENDIKNKSENVKEMIVEYCRRAHEKAKDL